MCFVVPFLHLHPPSPPTLVKNNGKNKLFFILAHIWHCPPENGYALQGNVWRMCMWKKIKGKKGENSNLGRGLAAMPGHTFPWHRKRWCSPKRGSGHSSVMGGAPSHTLQVSPITTVDSQPISSCMKCETRAKNEDTFSRSKGARWYPTISYSPFQRGTAVLSVQWAFLQQQVLLMLIHGWILRSYITDLNSKIKLLLKNTVY